MSMRNTLGLLAGATLPFLAACGGGSETSAPPSTAAPAAAPAAAASGNGTLTGKVAFEGTVPAPTKVKVSGDAKCVAMHKDGIEKQQVKVKDGGLGEVLVYVKTGISGSYPPPATPVLLDQHGCNYTPGVLAMQAGQGLTIRNSDDTLHNVHGQPTENAEFNLPQPKPMDSELTPKLDKPELKIKVGCDVHPWMRATIHVIGHPFFAVTKEDGTYEIKGLPAGKYEVEALHPTLPAVTSEIEVKDGANKLDLTVKS
jgi:hypothetical protein